MNENIFTKWLARIKLVTNTFVSWILVSMSLFVLGGREALRHGHLYRGLQESHEAANARGSAYITTPNTWGVLGAMGMAGGRVHLVLDVPTSKQVLSRSDQFEKAAFDSDYGSSILNAGDDPKFWASVKRRLVKEVVPQCIGTAKRLSEEEVQFPCGVEVDLYDVLFDWVLEYQSRLFLKYDIVLQHPEKDGFYFRDVIDRIVSGVQGQETAKDKIWMDEQVHAAMRASLNSVEPCMGGVLASAAPEQHYANTYMVFIAMTPVFALFWSIFHRLENPEASPSADECFDHALRNYSPVPVMFHRTAKTNVQLGAKVIKKGDHVVVSPLMVNQSSSADGEMIPFGYGRHSCLMKYFVKELLPRFLGHLFAQYDIRVTQNQSFFLEDRVDRIIGSGSAYSRPAESIKVMFTKKLR
jgi:hypothetical protein